MARKTILPKKLGPLKIPKSLRRMGNKALADPEVVTIIANALASVGAAVAARGAVQDVPGEAVQTRPAATGQTLGKVADVLKQALEDATSAQRRPREGSRRPSKRKRHAAEPDANAPIS